MFSNTRGLFNGGAELLGIHRQNFGILTVALCGDRRGYFGWNHGKRFRRPDTVDLYFGD
jgi:hypothetical protein